MLNVCVQCWSIVGRPISNSIEIVHEIEKNLPQALF